MSDVKRYSADFASTYESVDGGYVKADDYDQLKAESEALRKALKTIREESHDIGACECAADALVDSGGPA